MINQDDLVNYSKFKRVIEEGQFDTQGKAMIPVALLFKWYAELGVKLEQCYKDAESKKAAAKGPKIIEPLGKSLKGKNPVKKKTVRKKGSK